MMHFESFAVVDWSSGNDTGPRPRKDAIWAGSCLGGQEFEPVYLRNRDRARDWIADLVQQERSNDRRLMIGFDFPFAYPRGFGKALLGTKDPRALWDFFGSRLQDSPKANNRFELAGSLNSRFPGVGPFWFNGMSRDIPHLPRKKHARSPEHGQVERRRAEDSAKGTFTCWQMGGAGAVGGQVMTGMAVLSWLQHKFPGEIAVWPFEPLTRPVAIVEVWPSLIRNAVAALSDPIKDRSQVRLLTRALARLPKPQLNAILAVEAPEEGWIFGLGHERTLEEAACRT